MKSYLSLLFLVFLTVHLEAHLLTLGRIAVLTPTSCYTDSFRRQKLPEELYHSMQSKDSDRLPWTDILTVTMLNSQFHPHTISSDSSLYLKYRKESFIQLILNIFLFRPLMQFLKIPGRNTRYRKKRCTMKAPTFIQDHSVLKFLQWSV